MHDGWLGGRGLGNLSISLSSSDSIVLGVEENPVAYFSRLDAFVFRGWS